MGLPHPQRSNDLAEPTTAVWFTVCAWCERIRIRGRWLEHDRARPFLPPADASTDIQLTHGICARCLVAAGAQPADRDE